MTAEAQISIVVELHLAGEPIHGTIDDGAGAPIAFSGWLELMSGFETVCERAAAAPSRDPPSAG